MKCIHTVPPSVVGKHIISNMKRGEEKEKKGRVGLRARKQEKREREGERRSIPSTTHLGVDVVSVTIANRTGHVALT